VCAHGGKAISDSYLVEPARVRTAAQGFQTQRSTPARLAGRLRTANTAETGDPGLDGEVRALLGQLSEVLASLSESVGLTGEAVEQTVVNYETAETDVGVRLDAINDRLGQLQVPSAGGQPTPADGIGGRLEPEAIAPVNGPGLEVFFGTRRARGPAARPSRRSARG
jgi:hypothetical protein